MTSSTDRATARERYIRGIGLTKGKVKKTTLIKQGGQVLFIDPSRIRRRNANASHFMTPVADSWDKTPCDAKYCTG